MATRRNASNQLRDGRAFYQRIHNEGAFAPVFLLTGSERFLLDQVVRRLVTSVFPSGRDDFNLSILHATDTPAADAVDAARMAPMFGVKRVVVVHGIERWPASQLEAVAAYGEAPNDSSVLVLVGASLDGRSRGAQRLQRAPQVARMQYDELSGEDLLRWIAARARDLGMVLDRDVPVWLVDAIGPSLSQLHAALERLDLYLPAADEASTPRQVRVATCDEVIHDVRSRDVFELTSALADGDVERALVCHRSLLEQGEESLRTLGMIAYQFRRLVSVAALRDAPDATVAQRAQIPGFRVRDYRQLAGRFSDESLRRILHEIKTTDLSLKSSRLRKDLVVERLLLKICLAEARPPVRRPS